MLISYTWQASRKWWSRRELHPGPKATSKWIFMLDDLTGLPTRIVNLLDIGAHVYLTVHVKSRSFTIRPIMTLPHS